MFQLLMALIIIFVGLLSIFFILRNHITDSWRKPKRKFPRSWKNILNRYVNFYHSLSKADKKIFEYKVQEFLLNHRITGIKTSVDEIDKVLVAASAVIPILKFPDWKYYNLYEVLIYPRSFNKSFATEGKDRNILGMVGNGYMEGKMILSKNALRNGFNNQTDKRNTAVHEFVHLIDKMDGSIDGIPTLLLKRPYIIPWLDLIEKKIKEIYDNKSDINPYGATSRIEFFAVISEYFFERPKLLAKKHPELYELLEKIFNQDMDARNMKILDRTIISPTTNCPCESGKIFRKCCGSHHFG